MPDTTDPAASALDPIRAAHRDAGGRCAWCRNPDGKRALWPCGEYLAVRAELLGRVRDEGGGRG